MFAEACGFNVRCGQVVNVHYEFAAKDGVSTKLKSVFSIPASFRDAAEESIQGWGRGWDFGYIVGSLFLSCAAAV